MSLLNTSIVRNHISKLLVPILSQKVNAVNLPFNGKSTRLNLSHLSSSGTEASNLPVMMKLTAMNHLSLESLPTSSHLRLPTLEKNLGVSVYNPLINPSIKDFPHLSNILEKFDPLLPISVEEPPSQVVRKEAARLIVIRRRKMRKKKLKKLRKKMAVIWAQVSQKREYKKEKAFQAGQMEKIREAEAFDPVAYVNSVIAKVKSKPESTSSDIEDLRRQAIHVTATIKK